MDGFSMIDEAPQYVDGQLPVDSVEVETDMDAEARLEKIRGWEAFRKRWLDHYQKKIDEVNERADRNIAWHKYHLARFFRSVPHKSTKTQLSYDLPSCQLVMKKECDKINKPSADDMARILLRLTEEKDTAFIKTQTTQSVDWNEYKRFLSIVDGSVVDMRTGEQVDDVKITHVEPEFVLKFKDERSNDDDEGNSAS